MPLALWLLPESPRYLLLTAQQSKARKIKERRERDQKKRLRQASSKQILGILPKSDEIVRMKREDEAIDTMEEKSNTNVNTKTNTNEKKIKGEKPNTNTNQETNTTITTGPQLASGKMAYSAGSNGSGQGGNVNTNGIGSGKLESIGALGVSQVSQASEISQLSSAGVSAGSAGEDEMILSPGGFKIHIEHATNMSYSRNRRSTHRRMHSSPHFDNDFGQQVKLFEHVVSTSTMSGVSGVSGVSGAGSDISRLSGISSLTVQSVDSGNINNSNNNSNYNGDGGNGDEQDLFRMRAGTMRAMNILQERARNKNINCNILVVKNG